jgi:quercetin dioxygenase-like cupin family protein
VTVKERRVLVGPGEGSRLPVLDIVHKVTAGDSGGSLVIDEWVLHPGQTIPPHTHANEDECSFVLDGELACYVGGRVVVATKGSYVVKPRGVPHAFYNAGLVDVRVMEILTPGGSFQGYFDEYEGIVSGALDEDGRRRARADLGGRYGISWHDGLVPEVEALFGIRQEDDSGR